MLIFDSIKTFTDYGGLGILIVIKKKLKDLVVEIQKLRFLES